MFYRRFKEEYLSELSSVHFSSRKGGVDERLVPVVGEIRLLKNDDLPRGLWRKAIILEVVKSADGLVRKVKVKPATTLSPDDERTGPTYRALESIIPLELSPCRFANVDKDVEVVHVQPNVQMLSVDGN